MSARNASRPPRFSGLRAHLVVVMTGFVPRNAAVVLATSADADQRIVSDVINGTLRTFHVPKP